VNPTPAAPTSDCEALDPVGLAQAVNAWTSLAYVAVGVVVLLGARRRLRSPAIALGLLAIAEGVGSVLFHGDPGTFAQWLHDVAFLGLLGLLAGWHLGRLLGCADRGAWIGAITVTVAAGAVHPVAVSAVNAGAAVLIVVIAGAELLARRRGLPGVFRLGLLLVTVLAVVAYALGRTGSPLCDPDSIVQFHGAWHVLTALAVLVWADRALAVAGPALGSGLGRGITDLVVGRLAVVLARAFHRRIDVTGREHLPEGRPLLLVVNHGNGFVDPIVVAAALGRMPRFIAKAALWKVPPARLALDALAVLPVYRRADGDDPHGNDRTFTATTAALARGDRVAIFPEGTTGDRARLDRVRSGAARIALGARAAGVHSIAVVPIGLAFESRVQTRSRVAVTIGEPLDLDEWADDRAAVPAAGAAGPAGEAGPGDGAAAGSPGEVEPGDRAAAGSTGPGGDDGEPGEGAAATELTEEIRRRLAAVSPEYETVDERAQLRMAAAVALAAEHPQARTPGFGEIERRAARLAQAPAEARARVVGALADHALRREMVGLTDADLAAGRLRRAGRRIVVAGLAVALLGPLLLTAALVHLPAIVLVQVAVARVRSTATKGTVRMLVGLLAGLLTWWLYAMVVADGTGAVLLAMAVLAATAALALVTWTWLVEAVGILRSTFRAHDRRALVPGLEATRDTLVAAVHAADTPHRT
jgi:1-acyl-sn-glycerol-3-phosphate acyltransferase